MPLDPQVQALLEQMAEAGAPLLEEMSVDAARQMYVEMNPQEPIEEIGSVEDRTIAGPGGEVTLRVYHPVGEASGAGVVFFHGGGWVIGNLGTHDHFCRTLCNGSGAVFVSVDYRCAPEAPFPAAPDDCFAATQWVAENAAPLGISPQRLAVAGDSAGGNLAAVVSKLARDRGGPAIAFQLLLCPVTEHRFDTASYSENADGYLLTAGAMRWFWDLYLGDNGDGKSALASPLRAADLAGLPPAHVVTAEYDPLRDEGEAYAERLAAAGVPVTRRRYDGQIHNFYAMAPVLEQGAAACGDLVSVLRGALGSPGGDAS
jgi:acetyl esterase